MGQRPLDCTHSAAVHMRPYHLASYTSVIARRLASVVELSRIVHVEKGCKPEMYVDDTVIEGSVLLWSADVVMPDLQSLRYPRRRRRRHDGILCVTARAARLDEAYVDSYRQSTSNLGYIINVVTT